MNTITFYRAGNIVASIHPENGSVQQKELMGANEIRVIFKSATHVPLQIRDYCTVFGEKYIIQIMPIVKKLGKNWYEYNLTARSETLDLEKAQYLFFGPDNSLKEADFSLVGDALDFVKLVVDNMNRIDPGWQVGSVVTTPEFQNLTFSKDTCLSALNHIAEQYKTEFWIEGKVISLGKFENHTTKAFSQGRGAGLYEITRTYREDEPLITRLYAFGSDKNLLPDYRNYSNRLLMTGGAPYLEKNVAKYGVIENTAIFNEVFPHRDSVVDWVDPSDPLKIKDSTLDFNINDYLLPGTEAKVTFNSGQLAGVTCEIENYDHATKTITLIPNRDSPYLDLPNDTIRPEVGDVFVLTDIFMPQSYVDAAEAELVNKATEFLDKHCEPVYNYQVVFDQQYIKDQGVSLNIGDVVTIVDEDFQVSKKIRVMSTIRDIVKEHDIKVELSDTVAYGAIQRLQIQTDINTRNVLNITRQLRVIQVPSTGTTPPPAPPVHASVATITPTGNFQIAYDNGTGNPIDKVLRVGSPTSNSLRTITINAVFHIRVSQFVGANQWVQVGIIGDDTYRPNNYVTQFGPGSIDATGYRDSFGSAFTGTVNYTKMHIRINPSGMIFVWVEGAASYASIAGIWYMIFPIHATFFRIA